MNLADALVPRTFTDGELIIEQGDDADGMYFVEEGTVRITRAEQGQDEVQVRHHRGCTELTSPRLFSLGGSNILSAENEVK